MGAFQDKLLNSLEYWAPALQPRRYWKEHDHALENYVVCNKAFDDLKQLYIEAFETHARIAVLAVGLEAIAQYDSLELPTNKGRMTLWEFEKLPNAAKVPHIARLPAVEAIFPPYMDTDLRNGIGHNSAHYDASKDQVIWRTKSNPAEKMHYTVFADRVVQLCSALLHTQEYCFQTWVENGGDIGL